MPLPTPPEGPPGSGTPEEVPAPASPDDDTYAAWGAPLDQNRLPAENLRLLELATASSDNAGNWSAVFDPVTLGMAWWGTISVPNLTPSQTAKILVGNKQIGVIPGSSPWGPIAALGGERVTLTATGLTPNTVYQGVWVGIIRDNLDVRDLVAPLPIAVPLAGGGGTVVFSGDLSGTDAGPQTVVGIDGIPLSGTAPTDGQVYEYSAGLNLWVPTTPSAGGVTSYNTRTGAVTSQASDVESTFGADGQLFVGTGAGTGTLLSIGSTGMGLVVVAGTAAWQAIVNSFNTRTGAIVLTAADVEALFTAKGQLFLGSGSGTGALLAIGSTGQALVVAGGTATWAAIVNSFNTRTGAVTLSAADVEALFSAKGDLFLGTGAGAGTLLGVGTTGQVLTVSGGTAVWSSPAAGGVSSVTAGAGGSLVISPTTGAVVASRAALTGDATASADSNATTVVAIQGQPWDAGTPADSNVPYYKSGGWHWGLIGGDLAPHAPASSEVVGIQGLAISGAVGASQLLVTNAGGTLWIPTNASTFLQAANNLSDVADKGTSRWNLNSPVITACAAVAVTNVASLTGTPTIDGYALAATDHVLLQGQTTSSQNGPWLLPAGGGAWTRPTDFPSGGLLAQGVACAIKFGTNFANTWFILDTPTAGLTIDTSAQSWFRAFGGVTTFNTRFGAVTFLLGDAETIFTAAGQLLYGTGSGTGALLAAGATGTVLEGGTTPAWGVLPGTILATQQYAPVSATTYTVAKTTIAVLDTTNATLAFTVPANGIVDVLVAFVWQIATTAASSSCFAALFNHSGGALIGNPTEFGAIGTTTITSVAYASFKFHLTGLTPGALQVDLAAGSSTAAAATFSIFAQANSSKTVASNAVAPLIMQAIASV